MTPPEKDNISIISQAIESKSLIRFWYENTTTSHKDWRVVEPYLIGKFSRKHLQLSAWRIPTTEQLYNGQKESWRAYIIRNISQVQILEQSFEVRVDYDPTGNGMSEIICGINK
ncbi:MAG: WYL domain-containing protein [Bacteroidia bacterium]|nr:WYL domain-containing protein [Bacteroidia bacterium]